MPSTAGVHPSLLLQALMPVVDAATQTFDAGVSLRSILKEAVLAGYLVGQGLAPATAFQLVQGWRMAGVYQDTAPPQSTPVGQAERHQALVSAVRKNMQDQATAAAFYTQLMARTEDPAVREHIRHARDDELKHYRMLSRLHQALSGRTFEAAPRPVAFTSITAGLKQAMDDEYEAFEEYRQIYLSQSNERIRNIFFELMTDELEHATRFNYALQVVT
jgi:rubrerythrin